MFIKVTQSGNRRYAQLVESFRNEEGNPRQRTICTLGRLDAGGEVEALIASLQRAGASHQQAPRWTDFALSTAAMPVTSGRFLNSGVHWALTTWPWLGAAQIPKSMC